MIKSNIILNKNNNPKITQRIIIKCDNCETEWESSLLNQIKGLKTYKLDLCKSCKLKEQIKLGLRYNQYIKAGQWAKNNMSGKTHIEMFGEEKALKMKKINSEKNSGKNNAMYGKNYHTYGLVNRMKMFSGKTYDDIFGKEKSEILKKKLSIKSSGKNNPMYGKPSPMGSGNGWCGWYNGWHFRSLLELSFMINVIERFNFKWKSAECKKYRIKYVDYNGKERNYFPDFILNDKYLVEIKPKSLFNTIINKNKKIAAENFCINNNLKYKLLSPKKLKLKDIKELVDNNKIEFIDKYKIKYDEWKTNNNF